MQAPILSKMLGNRRAQEQHELGQESWPQHIRASGFRGSGFRASMKPDKWVRVEGFRVKGFSVLGLGFRDV